MKPSRTIWIIAVALASATAAAIEMPQDWTSSTGEVVLDNGTVASVGCAPATAKYARKQAIMSAQSALARRKASSADVSGTESIDANGAYHVSMSEATDAAIGRVVVLEEKTVTEEGAEKLCVLVVEVKR